jgi:hypothetical protein
LPILPFDRSDAQPVSVQEESPLEPCPDFAQKAGLSAASGASIPATIFCALIAMQKTRNIHEPIACQNLFDMRVGKHYV